MRLAQISRTLLLACLPLVATGSMAQEHPNVMPSKVRDQLNQAHAPAQTQPSASKPSAAPASQPATARTKAAQTKAPKPAVSKGADAKATGKSADANSTKASTSHPAEKPAEEHPAASHRDPFDPLLYKATAGTGTPENLPPGKAGLQVSTLRVTGIVRGANGVIAVVANPQQRVYFLHEGDKLYDGTVSHITLEAVSFQEFGKDAFGKPVEHQVTKRLYPSPGESQ
jgi:Tfp pilus assembly protein PilP